MIRFGRFELDTKRGQLRRDGARVRIRKQTFQLLRCLVNNAGEVVSREVLAQLLWGKTNSDVEQRLNAAIGKLRKALNDTGADPRIVVTVPREGYRFAGAISHTTSARRVPVNQALAAGGLVVLAAGVLIALIMGAMRLMGDGNGQAAPVADTARSAYLEAQSLLEIGDPAAFARAEQLLSDAIAVSPQFSDAWAATAKLWCNKPLPAAKKIPQAKQAALTALEHDADNIEAHIRLAEIAVSWDRDWLHAQEYLLEAREIDPGNASVHHAVASLRYLQGRLGEGEAAMLMGLAIDPMSIVLNTDLAWYYTISGKYDKAIETCNLLSRLQNTPNSGDTCTLQPLLLSGQVEEAATVARQALASATGHAPHKALAANSVLAIFWRHVLSQLTQASETRYIDPVQFARVYAQLGDPGNALESLALAVEQRSQLAPFIHLFPEFRALHSNQAFIQLLRDAGMPGDPREILARLR